MSPAQPGQADHIANLQGRGADQQAGVAHDLLGNSQVLVENEYGEDRQGAEGHGQGHGRVGNLDQAALFYLQQRGIPLDEARALLTAAFLMEVVDRIEHDGAREVVRAWLTARL